jgi:hypothetical protein
MRKRDDTICSNCLRGALYMFTIDFDPVPIRPQLVATLVPRLGLWNSAFKTIRVLKIAISTS